MRLHLAQQCGMLTVGRYLGMLSGMLDCKFGVVPVSFGAPLEEPLGERGVM